MLSSAKARHGNYMAPSGCSFNQKEILFSSFFFYFFKEFKEGYDEISPAEISGHGGCHRAAWQGAHKRLMN